MARAVQVGVQPSEFRRLTLTDVRELVTRLDKARDAEAKMWAEFASSLATEATKAICGQIGAVGMAVIRNMDRLAAAFTGALARSF